MKIIVQKFGGTSVATAEARIAARNKVSEAIKAGFTPAVVVSAMGKTTNLLERLTKAYFYKTGDAEAILEEVKKYHFDICNDLFAVPTHAIFTDLENGKYK